MWVRSGNWNVTENAIGTEIETEIGVEIGVEAEAEAKSSPSWLEFEVWGHCTNRFPESDSEPESGSEFEHEKVKEGEVRREEH